MSQHYWAEQQAWDMVDANDVYLKGETSSLAQMMSAVSSVDSTKRM